MVGHKAKNIAQPGRTATHQALGPLFLIRKPFPAGDETLLSYKLYPLYLTRIITSLKSFGMQVKSYL